MERYYGEISPLRGIMINKIFEIIFRRKIKLEADLNGFYKFREYSDGISFFELKLECDFYLQSHNPKLTFCLSFLNHYIFYFEIYNGYHLIEQQVADSDRYD